jgi:hypothetical protein
MRVAEDSGDNVSLRLGTRKVAVQRNGHFRYKIFSEVGALALLTHYVSSGNAEHTEGGAE